jgi:hypothetical protein
MQKSAADDAGSRKGRRHEDTPSKEVPQFRANGAVNTFSSFESTVIHGLRPAGFNVRKLPKL